jgi:hypothetical protein
MIVTVNFDQVEPDKLANTEEASKFRIKASVTVIDTQGGETIRVESEWKKNPFTLISR